MKRLAVLACLAVSLACMALPNAFAASQDRFALPDPYLGWEREYLGQFPELQTLVDEMIRITLDQLQDPEQDILHNRICAALAYRMAVEREASPTIRKLAAATDIVHNIAKEEKTAVLSSPALFADLSELVKRLKASGELSGSPEFFTDDSVLLNRKVGDNQALIHHLTGSLSADRILRRIGGYSPDEIGEVEVAVIAHSTGYWYFREAVDKAVARKGAWRVVYPEPQTEIAKLAHDADLISQFAPESVVPDGSKWRGLARKRWGATSIREEGHIVYYVFYRLFEEAKTPQGKELAREKWEIIRPALMQLMGLAMDADPIKVLGVPKVFQ